MGKILACWPTIGKTSYANKYPNEAIDLESSNFLWLKDGLEYLSNEEFKGRSDRIKNPIGEDLYIEEIIQKEKEYDFIFISMHPNILKKLIEKGYIIHIIIFNNIELGIKEVYKRARKRGNNDNYIQSTVPFLRKNLLDIYNEDEQRNILIHSIPVSFTLEDFILNIKGEKNERK